VLSLPSRRAVPRHDAQTLLRLAQELLADRFHQDSGGLQAIATGWEQQKLDDQQAAAAVLRQLGQAEG
jgi:hypothetical protein